MSGYEIVGRFSDAGWVGTRVVVGDRVTFDGKRTSWLARASTDDGRYTLLTASMFGKVHYTIIDWQKEIRGPMNVIGWGLGIFSTRGPDPAIDYAMKMLRPELPWPPGVTSRAPVPDDPRGFEVSRRGEVPLRISSVTAGDIAERETSE